MAVPTNSTRNFIPMQQKYDRIVLLIDMDCFYCQVEEKLNPELKGQPVAVVQYNAWRGGGIIAVNYAARAKGVTRHMRGDEATDQCPDIQLVKVPNIREKADLSKYREAGKDVANVLQKFTNLLERASVDEAYLDITEAVNKRLSAMNAGTFTLQPQELINTYAVGYERFGDYLKVITAHFANPYCDDESFNRIYESTDVPAVRQSDVRLLLGASIANEIRAAVKAETGYECSAGIGHNKIIAKLACGMNKPNKQTIMPLSQIDKLFETLPVGKIKGLGGKFGEEVCERLKIKTLGQILKYTETELQKKFDEKNGSWLYYISRGIDLEAVTPRFYSKSIGCCKKFPGRNNITGLSTLRHWFNELATEIVERLEKDIIENNRKAKQMTVSYIQEYDGEEISSSRSVPLLNYEQENLVQRCIEVIKTNTKQFLRPNSDAVLNNPIKFLGISVGKFESILNGQSKLQEMFANQAARKQKNIEETKAKDQMNEVEENIKEQPAEIQKKKSILTSFFQTQDKIEILKEKGEGEEEEEEKQDITKKEETMTQANNAADTTKPTISTTITELPIKSFFITALNKNKKLNVESRKNIPTDDAIEPIRNVNKRSFDENTSCSPETKRIKLPENQSPENSTQNLSNTSPLDNNYQTEYVEYAVPELRLNLLQFQKCEICGIKIPLDERTLQTHRDHHFAQELSQKQRQEFRNENKTKITTITETKSKSNKSTTNGNSNSKSSQKKSNHQTSLQPPKIAITKFLKPKSLIPEELVEPSTSKDNQNLIECDQCQKLIKETEWTEHLDYHIAKQLQRELNQLEVHTVTLPKKSTSSNNKKLNNRSINSQQKTSNQTTKPITQFFTQPSSTLKD